jgi:hypothetical protein
MLFKSRVVAIVITFQMFWMKVFSYFHSYSKQRLFSVNSRLAIHDKTTIDIPISKWKINHNCKLLLIGSCFTETIGKKLNENKFNAIMNPQGILFNPISILDCIDNIIKNKIFDNDTLFQDHIDDSIYHSYQHHSSFSGHISDISEILRTMNNNMKNSYQQLLEAEALFITFGTSFCYIKLDDHQIVANCHKRKYIIPHDYDNDAHVIMIVFHNYRTSKIISKASAVGFNDTREINYHYK